MMDKVVRPFEMVWSGFWRDANLCSGCYAGNYR